VANEVVELAFDRRHDDNCAFKALALGFGERLSDLKTPMAASCPVSKRPVNSRLTMISAR
jgi:hypothetical protein